MPTLREVLEGKLVTSYNVAFDSRLLEQSLTAAGIGLDRVEWPEWRGCIMELYAQWYGEWREYQGSYTWQRLTNALDQCGLTVDAPAHRALGDAKAALAVLQHMALSREKG